jgi:hypothetical protein
MDSQTGEVSATKKRMEYRLNGKGDILKQREKISKIDRTEVNAPTLFETTMGIFVRWRCRLKGEAKNFLLLISPGSFLDTYGCSPDSVKISFIGKVGQLRDKKETEALAITLKILENDFIVLGTAGNKPFASKICVKSNKMKKFINEDEIMEFIRNKKMIH